MIEGWPPCSKKMHEGLVMEDWPPCSKKMHEYTFADRKCIWFMSFLTSLAYPLDGKLVMPGMVRG